MFFLYKNIKAAPRMATPPIGAAIAIAVVFVWDDESLLPFIPLLLLSTLCSPGVREGELAELADEVAVTKVVDCTATWLDEVMLVLAEVDSGNAGLVEEMSEDTDSSNEADDVSTVVGCVFGGGVTDEDEDDGFVVVATVAAAGVVAAGGVLAGGVDVEALVDVVASGATEVVDTAVVAEVTVCV